MNQPKNRGQWLIVIFIIGLALLNYPLLALYGDSNTVFDIPLFFVALFLTWAALIALVAAVIERQER